MTICQHCGVEPFAAHLADKYRRKYELLQREYEHQAARHAVEIARWKLQEFDRRDDRKGLQRKVSEQRRVIGRLEAKLRKMGAPPYAESGDGVQP